MLKNLPFSFPTIWNGLKLHTDHKLDFQNYTGPFLNSILPLLPICLLSYQVSNTLINKAFMVCFAILYIKFHHFFLRDLGKLLNHSVEWWLDNFIHIKCLEKCLAHCKHFLTVLLNVPIDCTYVIFAYRK